MRDNVLNLTLTVRSKQTTMVSTNHETGKMEYIAHT